jgi:hypothetical protein
MGLSFKIAGGPRQRSHSQVRVPRDSWPYFTVSDSRLHQSRGPERRFYVLQQQGGPDIPSGTGFPICRLLRHAGLRWKHSTPPPHGSTVDQVRIKVMLQPTVSRSWNKAPIWDLKDSDLYYCQTVAGLLLSLTRGRVCRFPESQSAVIILLSGYTIYVLHIIKCMYIQLIQGLCQSRFSTTDQYNYIYIYIYVAETRLCLWEITGKYTIKFVIKHAQTWNLNRKGTGE